MNTFVNIELTWMLEVRLYVHIGSKIIRRPNSTKKAKMVQVWKPVPEHSQDKKSPKGNVLSSKRECILT